MPNPNSPPEIWFLTGSQHLYGPETLDQVAKNSSEIVASLNQAGRIPIKLVFKPVLKTPEEVRATCIEAVADNNCIGVVLWMHTFSPAKMWIGGLKLLNKPILHLHTQFNRDLPWESIDMDFMNLNQSAHGDREAGFLHSRCASIVKSSSVTGRKNRFRTVWLFGLVRRAHGQIGRAPSSLALAITCAVWQ